MLNLDDADIFAARDLRTARLDGHDTPPWRELLAGLGIRVALFDDSSPIRSQATFARVAAGWTVYVHESLVGCERAFAALHEAGHVLVRREQLTLDVWEERWCNRYAAACLVPADSMRRAWRAHGADLRALCDARPHAPEAVVGRRLADIGLARVWLYIGGRLHHGERTPAIDRLAERARRSGYAENENARAWRLRDDRTSIAVIAA